MTKRPSKYLVLIVILFVAVSAAASDWADWRGPARDGISAEKGLPSKWSLTGENLAWKAPYGGRSTPVILGDRLYLENTSGSGENEQERILCFNADTGRLLWEYKFNLFQSDVPAHRVAWASPVADPETGNVYTFGVNNLLTALSRDGKKLWDRSITEEEKTVEKVEFEKDDLYDEAARIVGGDGLVEVRAPPVLGVVGGGQAVHRQCRRCLEAVKVGAPEPFGGSGVALVEPGDVVAVRTRRRQRLPARWPASPAPKQPAVPLKRGS